MPQGCFEFEDDLHSIFDDELVTDNDLMVDLYSAMCNMCWVRTEDIAKEGEIEFWSCSWRTSGAIVAEIRNAKLDSSEIYLDYYCSGNEGVVSDRIRELLGAKGWSPLPWEEVQERNGA